MPIPPRPTREHIKQFATVLTGYSFVQYPEFVRYADAMEAHVAMLRAALLSVEYVEHRVNDEGSLECGDYYWVCPDCDGDKGLQHSERCLIGNALKATA